MTEVKNAKCVKYLVYNCVCRLPPFPVTASTLGESEFSQVHTMARLAKFCPQIILALSSFYPCTIQLVIVMSVLAARWRWWYAQKGKKS